MWGMAHQSGVPPAPGVEVMLVTIGGAWAARSVLLPLGLLALGLVSAAFPATWVVDGSGSGDFTRIQEGVNAAARGDTVLVRSGIYNELVRIIDKGGLCLSGVGPVEDIIISADTMALDIRDTDPPARIQGLTLTGSTWFGALFTMQARVEVVGCIFRGNIFRGNTACYGGGLEIYHCEAEPVSYIENNRFVGNSVSDWGGAIFSVDSSPVIRGNTFYANNAPGNAAIWVLGGFPYIDGNVIAGSDWGGLLPDQRSVSRLASGDGLQPVLGCCEPDRARLP
jgi:hypothetical protein